MVTPRSATSDASSATCRSTTRSTSAWPSGWKCTTASRRLPELRREDAVEHAGRARLLCGFPEPHATTGQIARARVGRHDEDDVPEVGLAAVRCRSTSRDPSPAAGSRRDPDAPSRSRRAPAPRAASCAPRRSAVRPLRSRRSRAARRSGATRRASPCTPTCRSAGTRRRARAPAGCASSVLPTPVGPVKRKQPIGLSGLRKPERDSLIAR